MFTTIKAYLLKFFLNLSAKAKYALLLILLWVGSSLWVRRAAVKGERLKVERRDVRDGLKKLEQIDEIEQKVNLMSERDLANWLQRNKEWLRSE